VTSVTLDPHFKNSEGRIQNPFFLSDAVGAGILDSFTVSCNETTALILTFSPEEKGQ
jgi:hypothetical protein